MADGDAADRSGHGGGAERAARGVGSPLAAQSVLFMVLRRLRTPLIVIVLSYSVSVLGLTLIPGVADDGSPAPPMSFFHAFYFVSYTATTIGFGEVPATFSDAQRMWTIVIIHLTVIGWTYALLNVLSLFQDRAFQRAVGQIRLAGRVRRTREPFHLICGAGDTGQRLARLLDRRDMRFVIVEKDEGRIAELELEDLRIDPPILHADAALPQSLLTAGLRHPMCRGVLALTPDDGANLAIATAARLLNRGVPVIAGAQSPRTATSMRAFGTHHVISPFDTFADQLILAMREPGCYRLLSWLTAPLDAELEKEHEPPRGPWVVCGHGRFGHAVSRRLIAEGLQVTAVDPAHDDGDADPAEGLPARLRGVGTETEVLARAGIDEAVGLVAAADNDVTNLAIAALARSRNPKLFVVLRQNEAANQVLFDAFRADMVMKPSEIIADECVALLTTPLLDRFLAVVRRKNDAWADEVIHQLRKRVGTRSPRAWTVRLDPAEAPAVSARLHAENRPTTIGELLRDPRNRKDRLPAQALMLLRGGGELLLPNDDTALAAGDRILFAGRGDARRRMQAALFDEKLLEYLCTGRDTPGGWLFERRAG
ncbi:NAD-binding protein [Burkholderiaceae bacterium FT117]|uniref:potassium channel family protein n=1 Tax=Zeimonas sediminis TaxID=2944268 RepID=UPI002342F1CE|nr:potassium channel protein [Zeimonas sediminis]MCM5571000.1 NAD-binding protein [Zeimonas sediminis]